MQNRVKNIGEIHMLLEENQKVWGQTVSLKLIASLIVEPTALIRKNLTSF